MRSDKMIDSSALKQGPRLLERLKESVIIFYTLDRA